MMNINENDEQELKKQLGEQRYNIIIKKGTEAPFTGELLNNHLEGNYSCYRCKTPIFKSSTKFDSHSGWPSFYQPIDDSLIKLNEDNSHGMRRVKIINTFHNNVIKSSNIYWQKLTLE